MTDTLIEPAQKVDHSKVVVGVIFSIALATAATALLHFFGANTKLAVGAGVVVLLWTLRKERAIRTRAKLLRPVSAEELCEAGLGPLPADATAKEMYLDTMKRALLNIIYHESSAPMWRNAGEGARCDQLQAMDLVSRIRGADFSRNSMTLLGLKRLDNLQFCIEEILERQVPGDFLEAGAFKGGGCIYMKAVLQANRANPEQTDRRIFVCDTFSAEPRPPHVPGWLIGQLILLLMAALSSIPSRGWRRKLVNIYSRMQSSFPAVEDPSDHSVAVVTFFLRHMWEYNPIGGAPEIDNGLPNVRSHFARFGLLDDQVVFLPGFFSDTLPSAPLEALALLRIDGDTYESTMDSLRPMYHKLSEGGFCIIDDYFEYPECRRAVTDFRTEHNVEEPIHQIDWNGAYWIKGKPS